MRARISGKVLAALAVGMLASLLAIGCGSVGGAKTDAGGKGGKGGSDGGSGGAGGSGGSPTDGGSGGAPADGGADAPRTDGGGGETGGTGALWDSPTSLWNQSVWN